MKYAFKDILNQDIYDNTLVMMVFGKYTIFNQLVSDTLKEKCVNLFEYSDAAISISDDFGLDTEDTSETRYNSVDFNTFLEVVGVPNINGRWFCNVSLNSLNNKQREKLKEYIKYPSDNGVLVVTAEDYFDYREFLTFKPLEFSKKSHMIRLDYTNIKPLKEIVEAIFNSKGVGVEDKAIGYFIMRMGNAYNDYYEVIDNIIEDADLTESKEIQLKQMRKSMKGIENFELDEFIVELTKPLTSDKVENPRNNRLMRMASALIDQYGPRKLVSELLRNVNELIEFRIMINKGIIPIRIDYFFSDVKKAVGKESRYYNMNEWLFRRKANLAAQTSLRDWQYIKLILSKASSSYTDEPFIKAIYEVVNRTVLNEDRINNIIGLKNSLDTLGKINRVLYKDRDKDKEENNREVSVDG